MPNPDLSNFVDLQLFDLDAQDVFEASLISLRENIPEWSPREGNMEVLLMEAIAQPVSELIFAVNRLPAAMSEVIMAWYGIERDPGTEPTVNIRFTVNVTDGLTIPVGTAVSLDLESVGLDPIVFYTDEELVIEAGQNQGVVAATANGVFIADANGIPANTAMSVLDSIIYVDSAYTDSVVTDGSQPEEDIDWYTRGFQRLQRLTETLVLPHHFEAIANEQTYIERSHVVDNFDADNPGTPGEQLGFVSLYVYGNNEMVSAEDKLDLMSKITPATHAGLTIRLDDPTITPVDVTAEVALEASADVGTTTLAIEQAVQDFLSPMTWNWGGVVRRNDLISLITNVPGVDFVNNLSVPSANITLPGIANLVTAGEVIITVI